MSRPRRKPVTLTLRQITALERAWDVLQHGYTETIYNSDLAKRHETRDQSAARVIDELLEKAGVDCDWYDA